MCTRNDYLPHYLIVFYKQYILYASHLFFRREHDVALKQVKQEMARRMDDMKQSNDRQMEEMSQEHNSKIKHLLREMNTKMAAKEQETQQIVQEAIRKISTFSCLYA